MAQRKYKSERRRIMEFARIQESVNDIVLESWIERPHSEDQLKFVFAKHLQAKFHEYKVIVEACVCIRNDKKQYFDIVLVDQNKDFVGFELKYKTKEYGGDFFGGIPLFMHGAQDCGRYDFMRDLYRLQERIEKHNPVVSTSYTVNRYVGGDNTIEYRSNNLGLNDMLGGIAIMVTNDPSYWENNRNRNVHRPMYNQLCIGEGDCVQAGESICWEYMEDGQPFGSVTENGGRNEFMCFSTEKRFHWEALESPEGQEFKYLIVPVVNN